MLSSFLQTRKLESSLSLQNPPVAWQTTSLRLFRLGLSFFDNAPILSFE